MTRDEIIIEAKAEGGMFIVIPSVVKLDEELPLSAQMLYGIITWKCNKYAFTWATNRELGEALGVSSKRVSALLSQLEQRGHIETEIKYKDGTNEVLHRYIYPVMKSARSIHRGDPPPKNKDTPPSERAYPSPGMSIPPPENKEVICNINKQKENIKDLSPYSPPEGDGAASDIEPEDKPAPVDKPAPKSRTRRTRQKKSVPTHAPERFEQFWAVYPGGGSRLKAVEAWDTLAPSDELIDEMARALKAQMRSRRWRDGIGIPYASTWLKQKRWTDKLPEVPQAREASGCSWSDAPD